MEIRFSVVAVKVSLAIASIAYRPTPVVAAAAATKTPSSKSQPQRAASVSKPSAQVPNEEGEISTSASRTILRVPEWPTLFELNSGQSYRLKRTYRGATLERVIKLIDVRET
jgi:hypothetical protein